MPKEFPSDNEIIILLKESSENLDIVYKKHCDYCLNFMKKINFNEELNKDIFHDALIVLTENLKKENFVLNCKIQTYLNSICRNQLLVRLKGDIKKVEYSEDFDERIDDWFDDEEEIKNERISVVIKALEKMKEYGGKCYEILRRFFYENQKMDKIAFDLNYTNADNAKNQKARCQKNLKELVFEMIQK
jgi:hypothetical protein